MAKRPWSTDFTPKASTKKLSLNIANVPVTLRQRFARKCRQVGVSQRNLILSWITNWVAGRRPDVEGGDK